MNWTDARSPFPFWIGSVAEAVFTIGSERNADKIIGASYVRLLPTRIFPLLTFSSTYYWHHLLTLSVSGTSVPKPQLLRMGP